MSIFFKGVLYILDLEYYMGLESSWEYLSSTDLPVFIYGMGDGALKILKVFEKYNIACAGFFASDEFVRGHCFQGHLVHRLSEIEKSVKEFVIVLAFAASYESLIHRIKELDKKHKLIVPDVPVIGEGLFTKEYLKDNFDNIKSMYDLLYDQQSKLVYEKVLAFKITGDIKFLENIETLQDEYYNVLCLKDDEVFVDLGSYNGDTIIEFIQAVDNKYKRIIAFEPSGRNFRKLKEKTKDYKNVEYYNCAAWSEDTELNFSNVNGRQAMIVKKGEEIYARSVDSVMNGDRVSFLKMDVEGAEKFAIKGSANTIKEYTPSIKVALYHRNEDIFSLGLMINDICKNYRYYIRKLPYIPGWEVNLFCVREKD